MRLPLRHRKTHLGIALGILGGAFAVAAGISSPAWTHAQETGQPPAAASPGASFQTVEKVYTLPAVYVREVNVAGTRAGEPLTLTALVENRDDQSLHGDLRLQVLLLSPKPETTPGEILRDSPAQHDRKIFEEKFALLPNARATRTLVYTPPLLPTGDYRIRVQAITTDSRRLGWRDVPVHLEGSAGPFAFLGARSIRVPDGQQVGPADGPNLASGDRITLRGDALGAGSLAFAATPHLEIHDFNLTGPQVGAADGAPVQITPGTVSAFEFPLEVASTPGAYLGLLTLRDAQGAVVSGQAEFRWVVQGPSATVVSARFSRYANRAGEQAEITADLVGPADRRTRLSGTARIELLDGTDATASESVPVQLGPTVTNVTARFWLREHLAEPGFRVTILDDAGKVLRTYEQIPPLDPAAAEQAKALTRPRRIGAFLGGGLLLVVLVLLAVVGLIIRRRGSLPSGGAMPRTTLMLLVLAGILVAGVALATEHAGGVIVRQETVQGEERAPVVALFVNDPVHDVNGKYEPGADPKYNRDDVPLEFYASFIACDNHATGSEYKAFTSADGQKQTVVTLSNAEEKAGPYRDQNYDAAGSCDFTPCASGDFCPQTTPTYSATLAGLPDKPDNTVQLQGAWYMEFPRNDCDAFNEAVKGGEWRNVWINHSDPPEGEVETLSCESVSGWAADIDAPSCDPANASTDPGCLAAKFSLDHPQDPKLPALALVTVRGKSYRIPEPAVTARGNSVEFRSGKSNTSGVQQRGIRDYPTTSFDTFEFTMPFSRDAATGQNNVLKFLFQSRIGPSPFFNVDWIKVTPLTPEARANTSGKTVEIESGTLKRDNSILTSGLIDWAKICDGSGEVTHTAQNLTNANTALCLRFPSPDDDWFDLPDVDTEYAASFKNVRASRTNANVPAKFNDDDHGFQLTLKPSVIAALYDGLPHTIFGHAADVLGRPLPQLAGSTGPLTCACDPPSITNLQKVSPAGNPIPGDTVTVEGAADDPQDDSMTYRFTLLTRPTGSRATWEESDSTTYEITSVADLATKRATFVPDVIGTYRVKFGAVNACPTGNTDEQTLDIAVVEALPDLVLRNLSTSPENAPAGSTVTLSGTVANTGRATAGASTTLFQVDGADVGIQGTGSLAVNAEETESVGWVPTQAGGHTLTICADRDDVVRESDENNCSSFGFTVSGSGSGGASGSVLPPPPFPGFIERPP